MDDYDFEDDDTGNSNKQEKKKRGRKRKTEVTSSGENIFKKVGKKRKIEDVDTENIRIDQSLEDQVPKWYKESTLWKDSSALTIRKAAIKLLTESFLIDDNAASSKISFVKKVERIIFDKWFVFHYTEYAQRIRNLSHFIKKNPERFLKISPDYLATMNSRELVEHKHITKSSLKEVEASLKENIYGGGSDVLCRKCHKPTVSVTRIQTRSADEPQTEFFYCQCGHTWKE